MEDSIRNLASIQKIVALNSIPNADKESIMKNSNMKIVLVRAGSKGYRVKKTVNTLVVLVNDWLDEDDVRNMIIGSKYEIIIRDK